MVWPVAWPGFSLFVQVGVAISWPGLVCVAPAHRCSPGDTLHSDAVCSPCMVGVAGHSARRCGCVGRRTGTSRSCWAVSACRGVARPADALDGADVVVGGLVPARGRVPRLHFDTLAAAAEGCDALVATGVYAFRRAVGDRQTGHPLRVRDLLSEQSAVAAPATAPKAVTRRSTPAGWRSRQWSTHRLAASVSPPPAIPSASPSWLLRLVTGLPHR